MLLGKNVVSNFLTLFCCCLVIFIILINFVQKCQADYTIIDENYVRTYYIDNSSTETLGSETWDYSNLQKIKFKFLSDHPDEETPDDPVDTCDIILPAGQTLNISSGVEVDLGSSFRLIINGSLQANGTEKLNIDIKAGRGIHFKPGIMVSNMVYCNITSGESTNGGGIYVNNFSDLTVDHCTISANKAIYGGGIYLTNNADITIKNSIITGNEGSIYGGGLYCLDSSPILENNTIKNNKDARFGGGVYLCNSNLNFTNNMVTDNSALYGGGLYLMNSSPVFTNSIICNNLSEISGGGIYLQISSPSIAASVICNNLSYENGGGLYMESASPQLINTIIYGNAVSPGEAPGSYDNQICLDSGSFPDIKYCDVMGKENDISGNGAPANYAYNIDENPLFATPASEPGPDGLGSYADWSLQSNSPCINKGTYDPQFKFTDINNNEKPYNVIMRGKYGYEEIFTDIGAYEFQNNPPFLGDNADNIILSDENVRKRNQLILNIPGGFDVDNDDVTIVYYNPPKVNNDSSDSESDSKDTGTIYQYNEDGSKGNPLSHMDSISDSEGRLIYDSPNVNKSFTDTFTFMAYDGTSLSPMTQPWIFMSMQCPIMLLK